MKCYEMAITVQFQPHLYPRKIRGWFRLLGLTFNDLPQALF